MHIGAVHVALRERGSAIVAATDRAVTFGGKASFSVQPGTLVVSDPVALAVPPLTELAVSLYLPNETRGVTTHEFALNTTYVVAGNAAGAASMHERADQSHVFLADRRRGARLRRRRRHRSARRFDYRRSLDDTRYASSVAVAARREASSESRNEPLGSDQRRDLGQPSAARRHRQERARPFRSRCARACRRRWLVLFEGINDITFSALPAVPDTNARRPTSSSKPSSRSSTVRMRAASRSWAAR